MGAWAHFCSALYCVPTGKGVASSLLLSCHLLWPPARPPARLQAAREEVGNAKEAGSDGSSSALRRGQPWRARLSREVCAQLVEMSRDVAFWVSSIRTHKVGMGSWCWGRPGTAGPFMSCNGQHRALCSATGPRRACAGLHGAP